MEDHTSSVEEESLVMRIDEITDFELSILQYLWEHGEATTREITTAVYAGMPITKAKMASVQKLIERLEAKGCVERYDCGKKEHRLRPIATRDHFLRGRLQALADRVCEGALVPLVLTLVQSKGLSRKEREELRKAIANL